MDRWPGDPAYPRVLHVDLSTGRTWSERFEPDLLLAYLGGRGIGAYLLYRHVPEKTGALSPDNVLIFGAGLLNGTIAPCSGRVTVTTKSPATGLYLKTNAGGAWGAMLRNAGWSHIVIHGSSSRPVFLRVVDDVAEVVGAQEAWGQDVRATTKWAKEMVGSEEAEVACIGPAGENLVRFAGIAFSYFNMAGRGGAGAVMGAKKLKAIGVYGTKGIRPADKQRFWDECLAARQALRKDPGAPRYYLYGTAGSIMPINALKALPSYNFARGFFPHAESISGERLLSGGYLKQRRGCFSCALNCHRYAAVDEGPYKGAVAGGPEYETLAAFGSGCGVSDIEAIIRADELCTLLGLDTISTASVIQWAMECFDRGVLKPEDAGGLELRFGDAEAMLTAIERIVRREGLGALLAEGVKVASEELGHDSYKWAIQAKGLEQSRVETRSANAYALAFAVNPRGPDHLHAQPIAEFGIKAGAKELVRKITGDEKYATPYITEKRAEIVRWHEDVYAATDSLGFCTFTSTSLYDVTPERMASMFSAFTGRQIGERELLSAGRRIVTLERCFNVREGLDRTYDTLPWRLMNERLPDRDDAEAMNSPEKLGRMLDEYYGLHGWSVSTGIPRRSTLDALGLSVMAEDLERCGIRLED